MGGLDSHPSFHCSPLPGPRPVIQFKTLDLVLNLNLGLVKRELRPAGHKVAVLSNQRPSDVS